MERRLHRDRRPSASAWVLVGALAAASCRPRVVSFDGGIDVADAHVTDDASDPALIDALTADAPTDRDLRPLDAAPTDATPLSDIAPEAAPTCDDGGARCADDASLVCADLLADPRHCGACDHACGPMERCCGGTCVYDCSPPLTICCSRDPLIQSGCVDLRSSDTNCGACALRCPAGTRCLLGRCVAPDAG